MNKEDITKPYEALTSAINNLIANIKIGSLEINKVYSIFINLVHDLNTYLTLKQEEKKCLEKEIVGLKDVLDSKKEELQDLIEKGNNEINKQKEDFERIKKSEIERLNLLNNQSELKVRQAEEILLDARQKEAEVNEKIEKNKQDELRYIQYQSEYQERNKNLLSCEEKLKLQFNSLQDQQAHIKIDLEAIAKNKQYIIEKETSLKTILEEMKIRNKLLETNLSNSTNEKNILLTLKNKLDKKEQELNELKKNLDVFKKQLDDKEKNLNAYKEEIDYKMALERQELEKKKRKLVLNKK